MERVASMAEPTLEGCREKHARGVALLKHVIKLVDEYADAQPPPHKVWGEFIRARREYVFTGKVVRPMTDQRMWAVIFGDAVHNLRSALDHLVWQLVLLDSQREGTEDNQFPIASEGGRYWSASRKGQSLRDWRLNGVSETHKREIDRVQPYRTNEPGKHETLEALRELSNHDKHRLLHTILFSVDVRPEDDFRFLANEDAGEQVGTTILQPFSEDGDTEILAVEYECPGPNPDVQIEGELPIGIGVDPLRIRLHDIPKIGEAVFNVIETFRADFEPV
jgi:hypothetical protein